MKQSELIQKMQFFSDFVKQLEETKTLNGYSKQGINKKLDLIIDSVMSDIPDISNFDDITGAEQERFMEMISILEQTMKEGQGLTDSEREVVTKVENHKEVEKNITLKEQE
jgi:membrane-bound lytic murein transglycosylase B